MHGMYPSNSGGSVRATKMAHIISPWVILDHKAPAAR